MIDLKDLRENPDRYSNAAQLKRIDVDIDRLLELDAKPRARSRSAKQLTAEKNAIGKQIGQLAGKLQKGRTAEQSRVAGTDEKPASATDGVKSRRNRRSKPSWPRSIRRSWSCCCALPSRPDPRSAGRQG